MFRTLGCKMSKVYQTNAMDNMRSKDVQKACITGMNDELS